MEQPSPTSLSNDPAQGQGTQISLSYSNALFTKKPKNSTKLNKAQKLTNMESAPSASSSSNDASSNIPTQGQGQGTQEKRKTSPLCPTASPKKPKTIITCKKAIAFLSELELHKRFLDSGKVLAWNLEPNDPDYLNIQKYVSNGQRSGIQCELLQVLRIMAHSDRFRNEGTLIDFNDDPNKKGQLRKMLWHGTRKKNVAKILEDGLKLSKNTFQLFGNGIYFSDFLGMSILNCHGWTDSGLSWDKDKDGKIVGYLFLSDVLLGDVYIPNGYLENLPYITVSTPEGRTETKKVDSLQSYWGWITDPQGDIQTNDCIWPLGEGKLQYKTRYPIPPGNTYVVYETERVILKFLVKVKITGMA